MNSAETNWTNSREYTGASMVRKTRRRANRRIEPAPPVWFTRSGSLGKSLGWLARVAGRRSLCGRSLTVSLLSRLNSVVWTQR